MENFSFNQLKHFSEEGKWLLVVTSFGAPNFVFNLTDENNSLPITTSNYCIPEGSEEIVDKLNELLELRSENDIELQVKQVQRRKRHLNRHRK